MSGRGFVAAIAIVSLGLAAPVAADPGASEVRASLSLEVRDAHGSADRLVRAAEERGGYFVERSDHRLALKVPVERIGELIAVAEGLGRVSERRLATTSIGERAERTAAKLAAEEQVLERYLGLLAEAERDGVLLVEREVAELVASIETLRGERRLEEHRAAYARLDVSFRLRERAAPVADGRSSFAWIDALDLAALREDFRRVR